MYATDTAAAVVRGEISLGELRGVGPATLARLVALARTLRDEGRHEDAVAVVGLALVYEPLQPEAWLVLADALRCRGDRPAAARAYAAAQVLRKH
jgi:predicted Zn-dependent protease